MSIAEKASLLETEARIIAENETHAVIALRVEKQWLGRNMPFIAALTHVATTHRPGQRCAIADA